MMFRRAGEVLETGGSPGDAFVAYLGAGDFTELTRVLGRHGERVEPRARLTLDQLPPSFVDSEPWLVLAAARRRSRQRGSGRCRESLPSRRRRFRRQAGVGDMSP